MKGGERLYIKPGTGPCMIHDWPTEGLAARLVEAMRELHNQGGLDACRPCLDRAKSDAEAVRAARGGS